MRKSEKKPGPCADGPALRGGRSGRGRNPAVSPPTIPASREVEKELARQAGISLAEYHRIRRGLSQICLVCGQKSPPNRKLCSDKCFHELIERLRKMGLAE